MRAYDYHYYKINLTYALGDFDPAILAEIAIDEARERARTYRIPATWYSREDSPGMYTVTRKSHHALHPYYKLTPIRIKDIPETPGLQLVTDSQDVKPIAEYTHTQKEDFSAYLVAIEDGEYSAVYGLHSLCIYAHAWKIESGLR